MLRASPECVDHTTAEIGINVKCDHITRYQPEIISEFSISHLSRNFCFISFFGNIILSERWMWWVWDITEVCIPENNNIYHKVNIKFWIISSGLTYANQMVTMVHGYRIVMKLALTPRHIYFLEIMNHSYRLLCCTHAVHMVQSMSEWAVYILLWVRAFRCTHGQWVNELYLCWEALTIPGDVLSVY